MAKRGWGGVVAVWAAVALVSCPARPLCDLSDVGRALHSRWPTVSDAKAERDVFIEDAAWYWSHGTKSVDGYGVTMVLLDEVPGIGALWDHVHPVNSELERYQPNLLFFDQTDGPQSTWPLIGFGYSTDYVPCQVPQVACIEEGEWLVHEAGYHRVLLGDGGMTLADDDDLRNNAVSDAVDPQGCEPVYPEDLRIHRGTVRHGRVWTVHVWISPDGEETLISNTDPWVRWEDAPDPVYVDPEAFFTPDYSECDCIVPERPSGCG